jgi:hypothetical protein
MPSRKPKSDPPLTPRTRKTPVRHFRPGDLTEVEKLALKQVRISERNRLLRDLKGGEVFPAIVRVKAKAQARRDQYAAALKAARITKRDHGRTVIFDTSGNRFPDFASVPSKRKIYMLSIGPRGGRRLINPDDPDTLMLRTKAQPLPLTPGDFRFDKLVRIAPRKFRETVTAVQRKRGVVSPEALRAEIERTAPITLKGGDMVAVYRKIKDAYVKAVRSFGNLTTWGVDMLIVLQGSKKPIRVTTQGIPSFHFFKVVAQGRTGRAIVYRRGGTSPAALDRTIQYMVNDIVRAELRVRGMVSQGSASRIAKLSFNKGVARENWKNKNGERWFGATLKPVKITRVQFRLYRINTSTIADHA